MQGRESQGLSLEEKAGATGGSQVTFSDRLLVTRKQLGKSQRQIADDIGITKLTILRIENGQHMPKPSTKRLIEMWIERNQPHEPLEF
jgi:DNA-binding XRE family transcriptional regulator